jgi:hypothetical protein
VNKQMGDIFFPPPGESDPTIERPLQKAIAVAPGRSLDAAWLLTRTRGMGHHQCQKASFRIGCYHGAVAGSGSALSRQSFNKFFGDDPASGCRITPTELFRNGS